MPHFSKGTHVFTEVDSKTQYRLTGWINIPTPWNDALKKYEPRTQEQIDAQREIYEVMKKHKAGVQVVVSERVDGLEAKDFPVKHRVQLYVNNYDDKNFSNTEAATAAPAAPAAPRAPGWG